MKDKLIKDLTESEFSELIQQNLNGVHIEVSGVAVASQKNTLKEVEEAVDRLVKKHTDYLFLRKENQLKTGFSY